MTTKSTKNEIGYYNLKNAAIHVAILMSKGELHMKKSKEFSRKLMYLVILVYGVVMMFGGFNNVQSQAMQELVSLLADDK
ncbi:hypothetical protein, partial [Bacillus luti]